MISQRTCQTCGAPVAGDFPCTACSLEGVLGALVTEKEGDGGAGGAGGFSPFELPSTFGDYRVEREIAAGGMGVVYEAEDTRLNRRVALKMLRQVLFATESERLRFEAEAELASQLDHPNIVPILEMGKHEGQPFFTMKYVKGGNLGDLLEAGTLPVGEAIELMVKTARAVHFAHQHGVLHRDLKPANILIDEAGEPWLTDFGLAKLLDGDAGLTMTQAIAGTPQYMAPEQIDGRKKEVSTATDVWALGVILYQMLTGRAPFEGESHPEVMRAVTEREPKRPRSLIRRADRDLETLCLRCLEKDPRRRLSSGRELAEELERWQRGEPILARRISAVERAGKWVRRHPIRAVLAGVSALVVLGAVSAITWQWQRAEASVEVERRTAYAATLAQALSVREHHDLGQARRLLDGIDAELREFDWRLLNGLCRGDERLAYRLGDGAGAEPDCLAVTPDGEHLAILSADGFLYLRDFQGAEVGVPRALPVAVDGSEGLHRHYGLVFSPDGRRLAYGYGDLLRVVDARTLELVFEETSREPQFGWLDEQRLLFGTNGSVEAPRWPEAGAWIVDFESTEGGASEVLRRPLEMMCAPLAVSPDGRFFVLHRVESVPTSWARSLHVYRADGDYAKLPEPVYSLPGREYPGDLVFSASGRYLAFSAGAPLRKSARVVDLVGGEVVFDHEFSFPVEALAIHGDERHLALVGGDSVVRVYDFSRGGAEGLDGATYDDELALSDSQPVGGRGAHAPPGDLITRSAEDGRARFYLGHEMTVRDVVFDPAGSLVTAGDDGTVRHWPAGVARPAVRLGHLATGYQETHPAASADGLQVLYRTDFHSVRVCDVVRSRVSGSDVTRLLTSRHTPLAVLGDGRPITQDQLTTEVVIWGRENGERREQRRLPTFCANSMHGGGTRSGRLSGDERRLAGAMDGWLFSADLERGTVAWSGDLGDRASPFAGHDLSPDGEWVASSDFGARVTIHRFEKPAEIVATLGGVSRGYDTAVAFGRDGRRLYTGNEDGRIRVWDTATWEEIPGVGWLAHRGAVTAMAVSRDGELMATSGDDSLKLFPVEPELSELRRRERLSFKLDRAANWMQFAGDGGGGDRALLYSTPGGRLSVWESDWDGVRNVEPVVDRGDLPYWLLDHGAVLLADGRVLVAGGRSSEPMELSDCHVFDAGDDSWATTGALRRPRRKPVLTLLSDGRVLAAGGVGRDGVALASCELYDPGLGMWLPTGSLAAARFDGSCVRLASGRVLMAGGRDGDGELRGCEVYDPASGTWSATGAPAAAHGGSSLVLLADGTVFVDGGMQNGGDAPIAERYDPASGTWRSAGSAGVSGLTAVASVVLSGGEVLVAGKHGQDPSFQLYDPATGGWEGTDPLPEVRGWYTATLLADGRVLVAGGSVLTTTYLNNSPAANSCLIYDPETGRWVGAADLVTARRSHTATLLEDGRVLLVGGADERGRVVRQAEVFGENSEKLKN